MSQGLRVLVLDADAAVLMLDQPQPRLAGEAPLRMRGLEVDHEFEFGGLMPQTLLAIADEVIE